MCCLLLYTHLFFIWLLSLKYETLQMGDSSGLKPIFRFIFPNLYFFFYFTFLWNNVNMLIKECTSVLNRCIFFYLCLYFKLNSHKKHNMDLYHSKKETSLFQPHCWKPCQPCENQFFSIYLFWSFQVSLFHIIIIIFLFLALIWSVKFFVSLL